jgi:hypothetical protein
VNRAYYVFCRIAAIVFIVNTLYPVAIKVAQHRLAHDWLHSLLHLISASIGMYAGWQGNSVTPAKAFTWGIGMLYLGLGVYGWFTPGLFLTSPLAIPLGVVDNVFHLLLSVPALTILVLDLITLWRLNTP